jgi:hypothetical protein
LVGIDTFPELLNFFEHKSEISIDRGNLRVTVARNNLQDVETSVHMRKTLLEVSTAVVIHRQGEVLVCYTRIIIPMQSLQ